MPLPAFQSTGLLPIGIHWATWAEVQARFGISAYRQQLCAGLLIACRLLQTAGCRAVYLDGSFVTHKAEPGDFDACWDITGVDETILDPIFLDLKNHRAAQKSRFLGEFFPAQLPEGSSGKRFLDFFQKDKNTGDQKGIIGIDLGGLPL